MKSLAIGLTLALMSLSVAADERPPLYRVEIIVFTHADGRSDARFVDRLRHFDDHLDPAQLARIQQRAEQAAAEAAEVEPDEPDFLRAWDEATGEADLEPDEPTVDPPWIPQPWIAKPELSAEMRRALDRLVADPSYQVHSWRAWYQPAIRGVAHPRVRLHDDHIVDARWPEFFLLPVPDRPPTGDEIGEIQDSHHSFGDPHRLPMDPPPDQDSHAPSGKPTSIPPVLASPDYRLDGTVRLRQRQFLHLEFDLEWRDRPQPLFDLPGHQPLEGFLIHRLEQSRVVRRDRLEYFDSAWLGVLARIERFEYPEWPEPETDPDGTFTPETGPEW